jgi:uncharacterized lipoprotein YmbA
VTRKRLLPAALLGVGALLALAGCGSSPKTNFYTLYSGAAAPAAVPAKSPYVVAIGAVALPDGLDRPQIVLRGAGSQVSFSDYERWVGALKDEIALTVAASLKQALGGASVFAYPASAGMAADINLLLYVQRFDSVLGDAATVEVAWQLIPAKGVSRNGSAAAREPVSGPGYDALVAAHARALAAVSRDIAAAISSMRSP